MTSAGVGVAVHLDGFTAAGLAAHRALTAAGSGGAQLVMVFAGTRHDEDEYSGVLSAVRRTHPGALIIGCSATGVLTGAEEVENATAVAVMALAGKPLPTIPLYLPVGARRAARGGGTPLGVRCCRDARRQRGRRGGGGAGRSGRARRGRLRGWHSRRRAGADHHRRGGLGGRVGVPRFLEGRRAVRRLRRAGFPRPSCTRAWG